MKSPVLILAVVACTAFATRATAESPPLTEVMVSGAHETQSGNWHYTLSRSAAAWPCGESGKHCVEQVVTVVNKSREALECGLKINYRSADGGVVNSFESPAMVLPGTSPVVHNLTTDSTLQAELSEFNCVAREAYKRIVRTKGCTYSMFGESFETYYPPEAIRLALQGPVILSFVLGTSDGEAKDIRIAQSSLVPMLDEAARKYISEQLFSTNCPGRKFDIVMRFKLQRKRVAAGH